MYIYIITLRIKSTRTPRMSSPSDFMDAVYGQTISTVLCFASPHKHNHMDSLTIQEVGSHGKSWEVMGSHGKSWEVMGSHGMWNIMVISWGKMDEHGYFDWYISGSKAMTIIVYWLVNFSGMNYQIWNMKRGKWHVIWNMTTMTTGDTQYGKWWNMARSMGNFWLLLGE